MTRREAREQALALLFEMDFSPEAELEQLREDARLCRDEELDPYALEIAEKFRGNQAFIDAVISRYSTKWKLSRLPRTTAAILRMAICELDYMENVPAGACINEAVELAKEFSRKTGAVIAITGAIDIVADSQTAYCIYNGHPMMSRITGTGCQLSAMTAAYVAANPEMPLTAAAAAAPSRV